MDEPGLILNIAERIAQHREAEQFAQMMAIVAIAFVAFCLWLTVRVINRRERWAKWTLTAAISLPLMYVASFGPACWLSDRDVLPRDATYSIYRPLVILSLHAKFRKPLQWYGTLVELPPPSAGFDGTDCRLYMAVDIEMNVEYGRLMPW
jgi:hypothetical protein